MADLQVVAVVTALPGGEQVVRDALERLVEPTRAEAGCLAYDLFASAADPAVFITVERWRSQQDLDAHLHAPHIADALTAASEALAAPPAIHPLVPVS